MLFEQAREGAQARYHLTANEVLPEEALVAAARQFERSLPPEPEINDPNLSPERIADAICKVFPYKEFSAQALAYLGCEPASYQRGVVVPSKDKVTVRSMDFNQALRQVSRARTALGERVMAAARGERAMVAAH